MRYYLGTDEVGITKPGDDLPGLSFKVVLIGKSVRTFKLKSDEES